MLQEAEFAVLRNLDARYVRWHLIDPARQVAEIYPPTKGKTSWDFSHLDADMIPFLEASKGQEPIINFTIVPFWMFKTGQPIPHSDIPADPALRAAYLEASCKELVDPTGEELGNYFARIVSWYTKGGFTDENGIYHYSGYHYDMPWWGVLNEVDGMTPEQYTLCYDAIVSAVREVSPKTKFVGISLGLPSFQPEYFEYFLNPKNHRPGIPLDMVAYHFYAGAYGLGGSTEQETIAEWQYTFFTQAAGFLSTVRYIESIRQRLSPSTRVDLDELGALVANDAASLGNPEKAKAFPSSYWNLDGAICAYLYVELAKLGIDVATASGIYDLPHGLPGHLPTITFIDPETGAVHSPVHVLQLLKDNLGPGDRLVSTENPADPNGSWFSGLSSSDVAVQAFETAKGRRLLAINKRLHAINLDLSGVGSVGETKVVDEQSGDNPARPIKLNGNILRLEPFAVAVVDLE
jgi:hypothetical protein